MQFSKMCGPLQVYVIICLISLLLQLHNMYTTQSFSWVNSHKVHLLLTAVFNIGLFLFWGTIINSLCLTNNRRTAWVLIFAPLVLALVTTALFLSGAFITKVGEEVDYYL